jgi:hypothetical protein
VQHSQTMRSNQCGGRRDMAVHARGSSQAFTQKKRMWSGFNLSNRFIYKEQTRITTNRNAHLRREKMTSYAEVYVSLSAPSKVVKVTQEWLEMFHLDERTCLGRSLNVLFGPDTNAETLTGLVQKAVNGKQGAVCVFLYTSRGEKGMYSVRSKRVQGRVESAGPVCRLSMQVISAVTFKMAAADDGACKLIVDAQRPARIVEATGALEQKYNVSREHVISRTMSFLQGPDTDVRLCRSLLDEALAGNASEAVVTTFTADGTALPVTMRCTPVLGKVGVDFVLVALDDNLCSRHNNGCSIKARAVPISISPISFDVHHEPCSVHVRLPMRSPKRQIHFKARSPKRHTMRDIPSFAVKARNGNIENERTIAVATKGISMLQVKRLIENNKVRQLGARQDAREDDDNANATVAFFVTVTRMIVAMILSALKFVSQPPLFRFKISNRVHKKAERRSAPASASSLELYRRAWKQLHAEEIYGMSDNDLASFTPY